MISTGVIESKSSEISRMHPSSVSTRASPNYSRNFGIKARLYLKNNETNLLQKLSSQTQTLFYIKLQSNHISDIKIIRYAIQFFQSIAPYDWPKGDKFIAAIFQAQDPIHYIKKSQTLLNKISAIQFWRFISPSTTGIYDKETLQTILDTADPLLQINLRTTLLPYLEGGKEQVDNLLTDPFQIESITENQIQSWIKNSSTFESFLKKVQQRLYSQSHNLIFSKVKSTKDLGRKEKEAFIRFVLLNINTSFDFQLFLKILVDLHHLYGERPFLAIANHPDSHILQLNHLLHLLQHITTADPSIELENWIDEIEKNQLSPIHIPPFFTRPVKNDPPIFDLESFKLRFSQDRFVRFPLADDEITIIFSQIKQIQAYVLDWKHLPFSDLVQLSFQIQNTDPDQIVKLLAIAQLAIQFKFRIFPYVTQTASVLGILLSAGKAELKGRIAQVKTGEGKSTIVTMLAFLLAKQGRAVDIVSSSPYLAKRDQKKYCAFFKEFGITSSHISYKNQIPEHFKAQILYGSGEDFEFALLKDRLYFTNLYAARNEGPNGFLSFDSVIVDEVDNLFIDTSQNSARISFPQSEISNSWVYKPILQYVQNKSHNEIITNQSIDQLKISLQNNFPLFEHTFSDSQLKQWVQSACIALYRYIENKDYVVYENQIVIVDQKNTGRLCHGSRWQNGIHEFLEAKHSLFIQAESLTPISISHSIFYQNYASIFGLTGTAGEKVERQEIYEIYKVDTFDVPPFRLCLREDFPIEFCSSNDILFEKILQKAIYLQSKNRPLLIICKDITESLEVSNYLNENQISHQLYNEIQKDAPDTLIEKAGLCSMITVATNNAGRGTDIQLENGSLLAGGLHVIVTTLSESDRVREQAIGRSGRQGQIGSSETFLQASQLGELAKLQNHLTSEQIIHQFQSRSQIKREIFSQIHLKRSLSEKKFSEKIDYFFRLLKEWENLSAQEFEIEDLSQILSQTGSTKTDFSEFDLSDPLIKQLIELLTTKTTLKIEAWKNILKKIHHRIKHNAIRNWAIKFYQPCEKMILKNQWDHSQQEIVQEIESLFNQTIFLIAREIRSPREGIFQWICQKTGINVHPNNGSSR